MPVVMGPAFAGTTQRWRIPAITPTLPPRSCVARQEPYIPGALSILPGTVPGQVRGLGYMVPTYFRRELRDRVLQRPSRLRTFVCSSLRANGSRERAPDGKLSEAIQLWSQNRIA